jgi:broad specificity phosphatase PhoE
MLHVVRHGRTEANAAGLLLGRLDPDLDALGIRQATAVAAAIGPVDRVVSSPLLRAVRTAEAFGVDVETDDRWLELDYGDLDGTSVSEVPSSTWVQWRADLDWAPPGGESHAALGERVRSACEDLIAEAAGSEVVVVTHVSPIKASLAWALGVGDEIAWRCFVEPASVLRIAVGPGGPTVRSFNDVAHLGVL